MTQPIQPETENNGNGSLQYRRTPEGMIHAVHLDDDGTVLAVSNPLNREQIEHGWLQEHGYFGSEDLPEAATLISGMNADPAKYPIAEECATYSLDRAHSVPGLD